MQVEIGDLKLEDALFELNNRGYIVTESFERDHTLILVAQKAHKISLSKYPLQHAYNEEINVEIFSQRKNSFFSLWNGLKTKLIN
jgi:hypothetical protein